VRDRLWRKEAHSYELGEIEPHSAAFHDCDTITLTKLALRLCSTVAADKCVSRGTRGAWVFAIPSHALPLEAILDFSSIGHNGTDTYNRRRLSEGNVEAIECEGAGQC
jgi:hypothetical protein